MSARKFRCRAACGEMVTAQGQHCEACLAIRRRLAALHEDQSDPGAYREFKRLRIAAYAARVAAGQRLFEPTPTE
jgi:hypothetical protein